jgi:Tol biopolymer transport system component
MVPASPPALAGCAAVEARGARRASSLVAAVAAALVLLATQSSRAQPPPRAVDADAILSTVRVNIGAAGAQADAPTFGAVLSARGRHAAFVSAATTLATDDGNGVRDVFVHDLRTSRTTRATVSSSGAESDGPSEKPSLSADGRVVAFPSMATNLVTRDRNGLQDVFVRDLGAGTTVRFSAGRQEPNGRSLASLVSADGTAVVFSSEASNLVPGDRNGTLDVFLADTAGRRLTRVSVGPDGEAADRSEASSVDAHGRVVGFRSYAPNLVADDWNGLADVFVHDARAALTERVNVSTVGVEADAVTFRGMLSGDGRFVGFRSRARDLVPADTNDALDVFVHDRLTGETRRVSVSSEGAQADATGVDRPSRWSMFMSRPFLSADGRYAAFTSRASNLVPDDRNGKADVFVHDLWTERTIRVSLTANGTEANGDSFVSGISADGRTIAFTSLADDVVAGDTNGYRDVFVVRLRPS